MSGCSLHEAFPDTAQKSGRVARAEERRRAAQCGGPALKFLKTADEEAERNQWSLGVGGEDPDRQRIQKTPPVPAMGSKEGFQGTQDPSNTQWLPVKVTDVEVEQRALVKDLVGQRVDDVIGQKSRNTLPRSVEGPNQLPDPSKDIYGFPIPSYFGKTESDPAGSSLPTASGGKTEGFADFSKNLNDNPGYQLQQADFLGSFAASGLGKASGSPVLSRPSVNDAWKPLTPAGARSSFFEALPAAGGGGEPLGSSSSFSREEKETLLNKLDTLFARLEDIEARRNEYAHAEMSLFILSGLILMFGLETVRKMK